MTRALVVAALVIGAVVSPLPLAREASAQPARPARPAAAPAQALAPGSKVALVPLASLGGELRAPEAPAVEAALAAELGKAGMTVIGPTQVTAKLKAARQPALRACDGDDACLKDVGALVGASAVVAGEVGGLGDVQLVYLELVDVATGKELRRTQAPIGGGATALRAAVMRLVDPARHVGTLKVTTAVDGAVIFVDGRRVGRTPLAPMTLPVGAHALRVTHPETRDFVRFVDVEFEQTTAIDAELARYEAIDTAVSATGAPAGSPAARRGAPRSPAWYRRWWAVAGFSAVVLGGAIVAGTALADDVPADASGTIGP